MDTRVVTGQSASGATAEIGYITGPDGTEYGAMGAVLDLAGGYVGAYVDEDRQYATRGTLSTWSGEKIGTWRQTSRWQRCGRYECQTMRSIDAHINGDERTWYGRYGCDWGSFVNLRPSRKP